MYLLTRVQPLLTWGRFANQLVTITILEFSLLQTYVCEIEEWQAGEVQYGIKQLLLK